MRLGSTELILILIIAIALFGTSRIAGIGKAMGKSIREFKEEVNADDTAGPMKKRDLEQKDRKEDASALTERTAGKAMTAPAEMETLEAMPLLEHLQALRKVLLASMAAILIGFLLVFFLWSSRLVQWVTEPLEREGIQLIYTEVAEAFSAQTRMSLIAGTVLGSPVADGNAGLRWSICLRR